MSKQLEFWGGRGRVEVNRFVDTCPVCHFAGTFEEHAARHDEADKRLQIVYSCKRQECVSFFIATYRRDWMCRTTEYELTSLQPWAPEAPPIAEKVAAMSTRYAEILKQAAFAENLGLDEVAGGGYRKALEVLVKDFVLTRDDLDGEQRARIPKMFLGQCLKEEWIPDDMIRDFGERAAWLGNDEAHYEREWLGMDLGNLKELLQLTEAAINTHLRRHDYTSAMPKK